MGTSSIVPGPLLVEAGWEVCQQLGGIYTVLRSKAPSMVHKYNSEYCLLGPYNADTAQVEFDEKPVEKNPFSSAARLLTESGIKARFGQWLIPGRPYTVLLDIESGRPQLGRLKYLFWDQHGIEMPADDELVNQVLLFGETVLKFFQALAKTREDRHVIGHFHEWMGGTAIPEIRRLDLPVGTVFTTHATLLGRYIATSDQNFYEHLPGLDPLGEARRFNIEARFKLERAAAHGAHVFTTLSDPTALECRYLVGRTPDLLVPNGIHLERPVAIHEYENLHQKYKQNINRFVMGHFFPSYVFDLDKTVYFFTSGRYEYKNKGFDMTLEALAQLNFKMKQEKIDRNVVAFFVTRRPFKNILPELLSSMALMEELRRTCEGIKDQIGESLFHQTAAGKKPWLFELVDEYWWIRLRRARQAWKVARLPPVVTHALADDTDDALLNQIRTCRLLNSPEDPVKVIYHPDFINTTSPLFGMEYDQFVRGCHLGVFPSYYEPWGYTPLECLALGIPAVTSDLAGFGSYVLQNVDNYKGNGLGVIERRGHTYDEAARALAQELFRFVALDRRERIALRSKAEGLAVQFDWMALSKHYIAAHEKAMIRFA